MRNRVVVTGMGVVSSAGNSVGSFTESLRRARPCFSTIADPRIAHLKARKAGIVLDFSEPEIARRFDVSGLDRFHLLALEAAHQALMQADIGANTGPLTMGVIVGTCSGPMLSIEKKYERLLTGHGALLGDEHFALRYEGATQVLARVFGISGISATVVTACSASLGAIGIGADLIRLGALNAALVGGSDTLSPTTLAGFDGLKATCDTVCAPFSKPLGLSLGEAGAFMVIEELDHALDRNAPILAEIIGFGSSNDAFHCTSPDPSAAGQALSMSRALADAAISPDSIIYINAHGTGTLANDKTETKAVRKVFTATGKTPPISSTKSIVGHCLGAAGCLEVIASIACMNEKIYPSTANFSGPREGCDLDYIADAARPCLDRGPVMSNNFAFGGNNASLILWPGISGPDTRRQIDEPEKIVVTACGIVSPAGVGSQDFLKALSGSGAPCMATQANVAFAQIAPFDLHAIDRRLDVHGMDKASVYAIAAARLALHEAGLSGRATQRSDIGLLLHRASGSTTAEHEYITSVLAEDFHVRQVTSFPFVVPNSITGNICKALMLCGYNSTMCFGTDAGLLGLGFSWYAMRSGHAHMLLSGSVDEILPFEKNGRPPGNKDMQVDRVPGEGACMFMLETLSHAKRRNAAIVGEVCSFAYATETSAETSPGASAPLFEKVVTQALKEAKISSEDIFAVCSTLKDCPPKKTLDLILGRSDYKTYDVSRFLGNAPATMSSFNVAYALLDSSIEKSGSKKYILTVLSSSAGAYCAAIFAK